MRSPWIVLALLLPRPAAAQYAVLIGGLGGTPEQTETIRVHLFEARAALVDDLGFPADNVTVLGERAIESEPFVAGISTADAIRAWFSTLAGITGEDDQVFVVLFGHGSWDGERAYFNIPRRDLSDADYAALVSSLEPATVVVVNTTSASAPFVGALSAPNRIVITATRTPTQRNRTEFPRFFVEALRSPAADMDKSGSLSVREAFYYASLSTSESFDESGHLATEHALLDDDGDGRGHRPEDMEEAGEGRLAAITYIGRPAAFVDVELDSSLLASRSGVERDIAALIARKSTLDEDAYYAGLELLFVTLARLNDRIEIGER